MSAWPGAARRVQSSSDQDSSFSALRTTSGSSVWSQASVSAVSSFIARGSGAMSIRKASTIGHGESTTAAASKALNSGLTSPAVMGS